MRRSAGLRRRRWKPFAVPHQHLPARSDESRPLRGPALDSFHHGDCRATHTRVAVNLITNRITQELEPDPTLQVAWARAACSRSFNANLGAPHRSAQSFRAASVPVTLASGTSRACRCGILRKATVGLTADSVLTPVADHRLKSLQIGRWRSQLSNDRAGNCRHSSSRARMSMTSQKQVKHDTSVHLLLEKSRRTGDFDWSPVFIPICEPPSKLEIRAVQDR